MIEPLSSRRVRLTPARPSDYGAIYELETANELIGRWRYEGRTPSPEEAIRHLWQGVFMLYVARPMGDQDARVLGMVSIHDVDHRHGIGHVSVACRSELLGSRVLAEAAGQVISRAFRVAPLRKLYAEILEFNLARLASLPEHGFVREGCLREVHFAEGRYWDKHIFAVSRPSWEEVERRYGWDGNLAR